MTASLWKIRDFFEPYGQENDALKFHIRRARISEVVPNRNGGTYLRCSIEYNNEIWPAVFWDYDKAKAPVKSGSIVEIIFTPEVNTYRGISRKQLNISALDVIEE